MPTRAFGPSSSRAVSGGVSPRPTWTPSAWIRRADSPASLTRDGDARGAAAPRPRAGRRVPFVLGGWMLLAELDEGDAALEGGRYRGDEARDRPPRGGHKGDSAPGRARG